jgi:hypothetical protein
MNDNGRRNSFTPQRVGNAKYCDLSYPRVKKQHFLDFTRIYVRASTNDRVVLSVDKV